MIEIDKVITSIYGDDMRKTYTIFKFKELKEKFIKNRIRLIK